jgi:quinohemoprotein ethanol dehydrogenase
MSKFFYTSDCAKRSATRHLQLASTGFAHRHLAAALITLLGMVMAGGAPAAKREESLAVTSDGANWAGYGRTYDEDHYSPLTEINEKNVSRLGLVWFIDLPTMIGAHTAPLEVDGVLYFAVGFSVVHAVDARTGRALWTYDPKVAAVAGEKLRPAWGIRGIAFWDGKVYTGTQDGRLIAISARTGIPVWTVQTTLGPRDGRYITGAPRIFKDKIIIGHGGADFAPVRGYVTAYDARTGKQLWRFYTVPGDPAKGFENKAMQMAAATWKGEWWRFGGGGTVWNAMTYDAELNRVYIGTGNGAPWNQGIRSPGGGDNLFLCAIVALDADTGEYIWHYQTNPGETWDFNSAMDIELATLEIAGKQRRVILHAPKNGFFYVIDRDTGTLVSAGPFAKVTWATGIDPVSGRPMESPDARFPNGQTLMQPGGTGAHNWMAMAYSPQTRLAYIPTTELPAFYSDKTIDLKTWTFSPHVALQNGLDAFAITIPPPALPPPLGRLQAWDPTTQKQVWSVPMKNAYNGGVLATAGNLVFQGNSEGHFVAYAAATGQVLTTFDAQDGILAQPITYEVAGRQYVTVITGYSAIAASMGPSGAMAGWDYRTQRRRVLTFSLDAKRSLPPTPSIVVEEVVDDPSFTIDHALSTQGAQTYAGHCLPCHGVAAVAAGAAPDLRKSHVPLDSAAFKSVVHDGALQIRGMPQFEELSETDLLGLQHYLRDAARAGSVPGH